MATPTSSYRSLFVINTRTQANFIVKVSILGNVARGSRHIDWCSAQGQYFFSSCTQNAVHNIENFELIKDIAALGLTGEIPISFSKKYEIMFGPKKINSFGNVIRKVSDIFDGREDSFVCSVASLTSLIGEHGCYLERLYRESGKSFYGFFGGDFISKIFDKIFELFSNYGISIETHCQNTLIEISKDWKFTGKILYRDFDITSFDRARFPFLFPEMWKKYCSERLDRTSLFSNLSAREDIGKNFLVHSIDNLVKPCLPGSDNSASISNGEVKTTLETLHGCPFAHRCPHTKPECREKIPEWKEISSGHKVRCVLG
ncbi:MAG: hypothetical protein IJP90_07785 [Treponema sp.]|nr:hypothetical protein [Treponema sp.]